MKQVVLAYQPYVPATLAEAQRVAAHLEQRGVACQIDSAFGLSGLSYENVQLAICFGGDGTVLRVARWLSERQVPILPVAMGKLSFLSELETSALPEGLDHYLEGDFWLDERSMLQAERPDLCEVALNDVVLARAETPRAVRIAVALDDAELGEYLCDGMIVSTATGSTAYSLAAGGPVLAPPLRNIVFTPIAPHLSALHSLVVPETATLVLTVRSHQGAMLTIDGQVDVRLALGESVSVKVARQTTVFARRGTSTEFYQTLRRKLTRG